MTVVDVEAVGCTDAVGGTHAVEGIDDEVIGDVADCDVMPALTGGRLMMSTVEFDEAWSGV
jgi:hypothetical protein